MIRFTYPQFSNLSALVNKDDQVTLSQCSFSKFFDKLLPGSSNIQDILSSYRCGSTLSLLLKDDSRLDFGPYSGG